ncbi:MAG: carbon storage regulator [Planctomycetota bacterium]|jgi:hypothetical protein
MLVVTGQGTKEELIMIGDRVQITMAKVRGDNVQLGITARVSKRIASLPKVRKEKVITVRRQLAKGKYPINERLNVALDKLLDDLITKRVEENEEKSTTQHRQE